MRRDRLAQLGVALALAAAPCAAQPQSPSTLAYGPEFFAPKAPVTAFDMVALLPGFSLEEGEQVRGYAGSGGNVLIDARRPSSKIDLLADLLKRIPADRVARIELIRGGAAGVDMQGHTVLANVVLKARSAGQLAATAAALLYGDGHTGKSLQLDWSRRAGERAAEGSLLLARKQNPQSGRGRRTLVDADGALESDAAAQVTEPSELVEARGAYEQPALGGLVRLKGAFTYFTDRLEEEDHVLAGLEGRHDDFRTSVFRTRQGEVSVDYSRPVSSGAKLEVVAIQTLERAEDVGDAFQEGVVDNTRVAVWQGESIARAAVDYVRSPALSLRGGGEYDFNFLDGIESLKIAGAAISVPSADVHVTEARAEAFGTATWKPGPHLAIEAGVRVETSRLVVTGDAHNATSFLFPKPRLLVTWSPAGEDQFRLRLERSVSQLDFADFVTVSTFDTHVTTAGNPTLEPERDWIAEAAFEHHFWSSGVAQLKVSHAWLDRVIDDTPFEGFSSRGNIGSGRRETVTADVTLPLARVGVAGGQLKASGVWKFSRVTDPTTGERRQISLDQPFSGSVSLTNEMPRLKSSWRIDVTGGYRYPTFLIDEVQRRRFETQVDAMWEWKPGGALVIQAQVQNLTSARRLRERRIFDPLRTLGPAPQLETLAFRNRPRLMLSVRRSF